MFFLSTCVFLGALKTKAQNDDFFGGRQIGEENASKKN